MPTHQFNVIFKRVVEREVNNTFYANTEDEALGLAKRAMDSGDGVTELILEEVVDRNMLVDEEIDNEALRMAENHSRLPNA